MRLPRIRFLLPILLSSIVGCSPSPPDAQNAQTVPPVVVPQTAPAIKVENPHYSRWAPYPPGTRVIVKETTVTPAYTTETTTTYTLESIADDKIILEKSDQIMAPDGTKYPPQTQDIVHLRWSGVANESAKKKLEQPIGTYEEREETIELLGQEYPARVYKSKGRVEAGETLTQTWYTPKIPGGFVRSVHQIPGAKKSITAEVVEIDVPKSPAK